MSSAASGPSPASVQDGRSQVMAGCVVLITADRRARELGAALARRGATIRHAPVIAMARGAEDGLLGQTRALIADPPDTVVATTGVGFRGWLETADSAGLADQLLAVLQRARIIARGPKARGAIQAAGLETDWVAESEAAAEIIEVMLGEGVSGEHIAVQHHGAGSDGLDEAFRQAGARVSSLVVYRWVPSPDQAVVEESLRSAAAGDVDVVCFTSAPGAEAWLEAAERIGVHQQIHARCTDGSLVAAAVGPVTAAPLRARNIEPLVPDRGRLGALVRVVVSHYDALHAEALATSAGPLLIRRSSAVLNGRTLPLTPAGLEVLRVLARARGGVVSRADVLASLPGSSRDGHAAEVAVARVRDAIGTSGVIRTVVKRGYRLDVLDP